MAGVVVDMKMKSDDKNKALEAAIGQIEKAFGKGSVMGRTVSLTRRRPRKSVAVTKASSSRTHRASEWRRPSIRDPDR